MRTVSPILNLGFLYSRRGLLYRMDKKSDFLIFFGIKPIEQFFSRLHGFDEVTQFVNVLVSIIYHVTVKYLFSGIVLYVQQMQPWSHSLWSNIVFLHLCKVFKLLQQILFACRPKFSWVDSFIEIMVKIA